MKSKKTKITQAVSALLLSAFSVALAMSVGIYSFTIAPYIHDHFNTSPTVVVAKEDAEEQDTQYYKMDYEDSNELMQAKIDYIRKSVGEGTVLLKNENDALPISATTDGRKTRVTLLGRASTDLVYGMDAGAGEIANANTFCKHFDDALADAGFDVNMTMFNYYANSGVNQNNPAGYYGLVGDLIIGKISPESFPSEVRDSISSYNDVGIIVLTRNCGEGFDLWSGESEQPVYDTGSGTTGSGTPIFFCGFCPVFAKFTASQKSRNRYFSTRGPLVSRPSFSNCPKKQGAEKRLLVFLRSRPNGTACALFSAGDDVDGLRAKQSDHGRGDAERRRNQGEHGDECDLPYAEGDDDRSDIVAHENAV